MRIAIDENNNRIKATEEAKTIKCFCQCCGEEVRARVGKIRVPHFAHIKDSDCPVNKDKDYKSEWHIRMQDYFPIECQEIKFIDNESGEVHIADIYVESRKTVIEFQHSPITLEEFVGRTAFHLKNGRRIAWVFDESSEKSDSGKGRFKVDEVGLGLFPYQTLKWMRTPRKCLNYGPDIERYAGIYSICVYYGTEGDILHRIVRQYFEFESVDVSFHDIVMRQQMNPDEFFITDGYWQTVEPYKEIFDKYRAAQKIKEKAALDAFNRSIYKARNNRRGTCL